MQTSSFVETTVAGPVLIARLKCEKVTERESDIVRKEISAAAERVRLYRVAVDAGEVTFLTSVALGTLVALAKLCKENKGAFAVYGLTAQLTELIKMTKLDKLIRLAPDRESAVKAIS